MTAINELMDNAVDYVNGITTKITKSVLPLENELKVKLIIAYIEADQKEERNIVMGRIAESLERITELVDERTKV